MSATPGRATPDKLDGTVRHSDTTRRGMRALLIAVGVLLAVVIVSPIALSSQDLVRWASSPDGLGLTGAWPYVVFIALDAAAAACVGITIYAAARGESGGLFAVMVWVLAGGSAWANWRHGLTTPVPDDEVFFPAMSLAGPLLLELTVRRIRRWVQTSAGRYELPLPHFRVLRWMPFVGSFSETLGAWRVALLSGDISTPGQAVEEYRSLCPDGKLNVLARMRQRQNEPADPDTTPDTAPDTAPDTTSDTTRARAATPDTRQDPRPEMAPDATPDTPRLSAVPRTPTRTRTPRQRPAARTPDKLLAAAVAALRDTPDMSGADMAVALGLHNAVTPSGKRTGQRWLTRAREALDAEAVA